MNPKLYNQIIEEYLLLRSTHLITDMRLVIAKLVDKFSTPQNQNPVDEREISLTKDVIISIVSYQFQQEQKKINPLIDWKQVCNDYVPGQGILLSIAATAQLSPALVSQRVINHLYSSSLDRDNLKKAQFDSNLIPNCYAAYDAMLANYTDVFYGTHYTQSSNNSGLVFEQEVKHYLQSAGVNFMSENELRMKKYDVTPDFKLNVPIVLERHWIMTLHDDGVERKKFIKNFLITKPIEFLPLKSGNLNQSTSSLSLDQQELETTMTNETENVCREVINWVECKSLFANEQCHQEYTQNQYNSYANRFGKGLIIYKFGCIDTILDNENAKLVVVTRLPEIKDSCKMTDNLLQK